MNEVEQECIILNSAWEMIDGMVNWAMFVKHERLEPTVMMFETSIHARLFNILLCDFLSQVNSYKGQSATLGLRSAPSCARPRDLTFLYYLRQVKENPTLGHSSARIGKCVDVFGDWLEHEVLVKNVNLPDISVVTDIRVSRYRYLKICGDIAKHNLTRLSTNVNHIRKLLESSGHPVSEQDGYLVVQNFFEWFHGHVFMHNYSVIAEFLNNIRWAIFEYLEAEYRRSWYAKGPFVGGSQVYGYRYPDQCADPIARAMYWELMNRVRGRPWIHRFVILDALKERF